MRKLFIISALIIFTLDIVLAQKNIFEKDFRKLQTAQLAILSLYVDTVNQDKLTEDAIRGMLEKLDPHSTYTTAKETKAMTEPLQGSFEGIGVQFNMINDTLLIIQPVLGGPSEKVGILAGDRIISAADTIIAGVKMSREEIMRRLRGAKGTKIKLGIIRRGIPDVLFFTVTRDKIPITTIDASYMIAPKTGYIRIGSFGATTYEEFMTAVETLKKDGMQDLILDLQDNGGGYLQAAANIANEFLSKGDIVVYTQGRTTPRQEFKADGKGKLLTGKVVVLINEFSASASEIVSGALQDQDRATIVGRRSFGKGLVQRPIEFPDGSMIRLTIAHYYTPAGRNIQKPYTKGDTEAYAHELDERFKRGELYSVDSIHFSDSLKYQTLKLKRTVYGGGGIMPDVFVPLDTTQYTKYFRQLSAKSVIINYNLDYIDKYRKELEKKYSNFSKFNKEYKITDKMIDELIKRGEKEGVKPKDEKELNNSKSAIRTVLKALIARNIWSMSDYFIIANTENRIVQKGLEEIKRQ